MKNESLPNRNSHRLGMGLNAKLRCGSLLHTVDIDGRFSTHQHAMVCIVSGSGVYTDDKFHEHPFTAPCIVQRIPDKMHSISWNEPTQTIYIAAPFDVYDLLATVCQSDKLTRPIIEYENTDEFLSEADIISELLDTLPEDQLMIAVNRIQQFFTKIIMGEQRKKAAIISETDRYLSEILPDKIAIPELAKYFSMSNSSFKIKFTEAAGVSPGKYIITKRLELAEKMILDSELTLGEIAVKLKYPDIYTFSRQFKKYYGVTPSKYRLNPAM